MDRNTVMKERILHVSVLEKGEDGEMLQAYKFVLLHLTVFW